MFRRTQLIMASVIFAFLCEPSSGTGVIRMPKNMENCLIVFEKRTPEHLTDIKFVPHGTGFLFRDTALNATFAVTNRHILEGRDSIFARVNRTDSGALCGFRMGVELVKQNQRYWVAHPDTTIDLAVLLLPINFKAYAVDNRRIKSFEDVKLADHVLFLGFPLLEAAIGEMNYPLVRSGIVSFKTHEDIVNINTKKVIVRKDHIIIDGEVLAGNSGSPVLSTPLSGEKQTSLIGVLSSHLLNLGTGQHYRLGICIPAERIIENIESFKLHFGLDRLSVPEE